MKDNSSKTERCIVSGDHVHMIGRDKDTVSLIYRDDMVIQCECGMSLHDVQQFHFLMPVTVYFFGFIDWRVDRVYRTWKGNITVFCLFFVQDRIVFHHISPGCEYCVINLQDHAM